MTDHDPTADDRLLDELKDALQEADAVPEDVLGSAKAAFTWRTVDAELAELLFDSAVDELAGVRGEEGMRQLTFHTESLDIEITLHEEPDRRLSGQLVPPQPATVELRSPAGVHTTEADELGSFGFSDVPSGPVGLRCTLADGTVVTTEATIL